MTHSLDSAISPLRDVVPVHSTKKKKKKKTQKKVPSKIMEETEVIEVTEDAEELLENHGSNLLPGIQNPLPKIISHKKKKKKKKLKLPTLTEEKASGKKVRPKKPVVPRNRIAELLSQGMEDKEADIIPPPANATGQLLQAHLGTVNMDARRRRSTLPEEQNKVDQHVDEMERNSEVEVELDQEDNAYDSDFDEPNAVDADQQDAVNTEEEAAILVSRIDRILLGRMDYELPEIPSKIVRIFTSSTFTDTSHERNSLMENIYPKIKDYCRKKYGMEFQVVDMRWGVRDEATDDHMTTALCLNEIMNCQRLSVGPNFVVFLGNKYGYRPFPTLINAKEFALLRSYHGLTEEEGELLDVWYRLDENVIPHVYVLQPISSILKHFNNKVRHALKKADISVTSIEVGEERLPRLMQADQSRWWDIMAQIQIIFRRSVTHFYKSGHLTFDELHNYFMSVTEREVIHGILTAPDPELHCIAYIRTIKNINVELVQYAKNYVDFVGIHVDTEAVELLEKEKEKVPAVLPETSIRRYDIDWVDKEGIVPASHASYLTDFSNHFYTNILRLVDRGVERIDKLTQDPLLLEILKHLHACVRISKAFQGREDLIEKVHTYIIQEAQPEETQPLIIYGEPGCGKTSILAKCASLTLHWYRERYGENTFPAVIIRFMGTSSDSSSIAPLLTSLCTQMCLLSSVGIDQVPKELPDLIIFFRHILKLAGVRQPFLLFLDSLDQLSTTDGAHLLHWLPENLPVGVKIVLSLSPNNQELFQNLQFKCNRQENFIECPALGKELAMEVVQVWLQQANKSLSERQKHIVRDVFEVCNLALFVKIVFDEICRWRSYNSIHITVLSNTIEKSLHQLFNRIENQHGRTLVGHAFGYITASKNGISESELEDALSLDEEVLNDVYQYHLPPTRRIPPLLWTRIRSDLPGYLSEREADGITVINWYHRQFAEVAQSRYFRNINHKAYLHDIIADYFIGRWAGVPKPFEYDELQRTRFRLSSTHSESDRCVPPQPLAFTEESPNGNTNGKPGALRYNYRKLSELPYQLLHARNYQNLYDQCLYNYEFLRAKISSRPLQDLLSDLQNLTTILDHRDTHLLRDALRLSASVVTKYPDMLGPQITGRLLPYFHTCPQIRHLIQQCDSVGLERCALVPAFHYLHTPGGPLEFSLEGHPFAVNGVKTFSHGKYLLSASNQYFIWDLETGDVFRNIQPPGLVAIMKNLELSKDLKFAFSYTNKNQIIRCILATGETDFYENVVTQSLAEESSGFSADIIGLIVCPLPDLLLCCWTRTHVLYFTYDGQWVQSICVPMAMTSQALEVVASSPESRYLITRIEEADPEDLKSAHQMHVWNMLDLTESPLLCHSSVCFNHNATAMFTCIKSCAVNFTFNIIQYERVAWLDDENQSTFRWNFMRCLENEDRICAINLSSDETCLVASLFLGFKLWRVGKEQSTVNESEAWYYSLPEDLRNVPFKHRLKNLIEFTLDGKYFVVAVKHYLLTYQVDNCDLVRSFDTHFGRIVSMCYVPQSNKIVTGSIDKTVKVFNFNNILEKTFHIDRMERSLESIYKAADCLRVVTKAKNAVGIWSLESGELLRTFTPARSALVVQLFLLKDGDWLISMELRSISVWSLDDHGQESCLERVEIDGEHFAMIVFEKEKRCITFQRSADGDRGKAVCRSLPEWMLVFEFTFTPWRGVQANYPPPVITSRGNFFAVPTTGRDDSLVIGIYNSQNGRFIGNISAKRLAKFTALIAIRPMNNLIGLIEEKRGVIFDLRKKAQLRSIPRWSGAQSPDGLLGAYAPQRGGLELIDMKKGATKKVLIPKVAEGLFDNKVFFTENGQHVIYYHSGHRTIRVFRLSDGAVIAVYRMHAEVRYLCGSACGLWVFVGGEDGSLTCLVVVDPKVPASRRYLNNLPSRKIKQTY